MKKAAPRRKKDSRKPLKLLTFWWKSAILIIVNSDTVNDIIYLIINAKTKVQNGESTDDGESYNLDFLDSDNNTIINLTSTTITYKEKYYSIDYNYELLLELIASVE